jgi:hypothetical protein
MSGQAKRSRVLSAQRHRRAVARELASVVRYTEPGGRGRWLGRPSRLINGSTNPLRDDWDKRVSALLDGATFDVHAAREHAFRVVALGQHRAKPDHLAVLADWRLANPHLCPTASPLARGVTGHGLDHARLGQRILDMLEGQPSECQRCIPETASLEQCIMAAVKAGRRAKATATGVRQVLHIGHRLRCYLVAARAGVATDESLWDRLNETVSCLDVGFDTRHECPDCKGTGHNLRGVLPDIEWSPAVVRKVSDSAYYSHDPGASWASRLADVIPPNLSPSMLRPTRVTPRGEHRAKTLLGGGGLYPHERYSAERVQQILPRWRRGELEHARQRRERVTRRGDISAAASLPGATWELDDNGDVRVTATLPGRIESIRVTGEIEL